MKAPDKIYIVNATFPDYVDFDGSPISTKRIDDHDIEYIRKDALVKYLYEEKGYPITLNGELVHWDELNKHLTEYIKLKKDAFIEKAEKAMIEWAGTYISKTTGGGVKERKSLANDLLSYFKNYIKE